MQDGRYSWLNMPSGRAAHLLDEEDERLGWDLPDDGEHSCPFTAPRGSLTA